MANAPLSGQDAWNKPVIWVRRKEEIFFKTRLDTLRLASKSTGALS
jgi:hypothetical protein